MERSAYRIIDANFNRAREALRVMEEYCRFALNCALLTERAKQLRHRLSSALARLEQHRLIAARDTDTDVGAAGRIPGRLKRSDVRDTFIAAAKRLTEALRVLAEIIQPTDPAVANEMEQMRFDAYKLEKDIVLFGDTAEKFKKVRLYVIISSTLPAEVLSVTNKCAAGGADCIQLRAKNISDDTLLALAREFCKLCRDAGVLSIINDRVDIAVAADADGVHLGQNDLPVEQARKLQLTPLVIGTSTHSGDQLRQAVEQLPTYVGLGPVFTTPTKSDAKPVGLDYLRQATDLLAKTGIASVAIGGITLDNLEQVLKTGVSAVAVCSAIAAAADPQAACEQFKANIADFCTEI